MGFSADLWQQEVVKSTKKVIKKSLIVFIMVKFCAKIVFFLHMSKFFCIFAPDLCNYGK